MEIWTLDLNLHLSSQGTLFLFDNMLFALSYAQHTLFTPVWLSLLGCSLHALLFSFVSFFACLLACFLVGCMYTHRVRTLGVRAPPPIASKKGKDASKKSQSPKREMFSRLEAQPPRVVMSFYLRPLASSLKHVLGSPSMYSLYFSCFLLVLHSLNMTMFVYISYTLLGHTFGTLAMSDLLFLFVWLHCV